MSAQSSRPLAGVMFDLDGTLADTAPDFARALNRLREEEGCAPLAFRDIRPIVSLGSPAMIKLAFGCEPGEAAYARLHPRFLDLYREDLATETRLFPGVEEVLGELERDAVQWAVVTNKPGWLTAPLLDALGLGGRAACVVSGDTLPNRKPHPDQLLYACRRANAAPRECLYVGDSRKDVEAGRRAGMRTVVALYGYIPVGEDPLDWGADWEISDLVELIPRLRAR